MGRAVQYQLSCKIDSIQGAEQSYGAVAVSVDMTDEAFGKGICEVEMGTLSPYAQINESRVW